MARNGKFDLVTHVRDGKGNIVSKNPYRLVIENGVHRYERPPGSGYWYDAAGTVISEPKAEKPAQAAAPVKATTNGSSPKV